MGMLEPQTGFLWLPTIWWPFLEFLDLGHLWKPKTPGDTWALIPSWCWRASSPVHQGLPSALHRLPSCLPLPWPLAALQDSWKHVTSSGSRGQEYSGHLPGRPRGGNGDILSAFTKQTPGCAEGGKAPGILGSRQCRAGQAVVETDKLGRVDSHHSHLLLISAYTSAVCTPGACYTLIYTIAWVVLGIRLQQHIKSWMLKKIQSMLSYEKISIILFLIWAKNPTEFKRSLTRQLILGKLEGHQGKCEQKRIPAQLHIHLLKDAELKLILHWWHGMKEDQDLQKIKVWVFELEGRIICIAF